MKFPVNFHHDEDGMYIAECPSIPGCVSQGQTETEAETNIGDAIRECQARQPSSFCSTPQAIAILSTLSGWQHWVLHKIGR